MRKGAMQNWRSRRTNGSGPSSIANHIKKEIMPKEKNYKWKLGLFSIAALVIAVAGIYYVGKERNKFGSVVHLTTYFNSVSGLKQGSNVRVGGIDVGTVDGISLVNDTTVQVDMVIQTGIRKF